MFERMDRSAAKRDNGRVSVHASLAELLPIRFHSITLFKVLEHLDDPLNLLKDVSTFAHIGDGSRVRAVRRFQHEEAAAHHA